MSTGTMSPNQLSVNEQIDLLHSILRQSTEYSIIALDLNCNIIVWNEGARLKYRYTAEEVLGKNIAIIHDPEDVKSGKVKAIFHDAKRDGRWEGEVKRVPKNGNTFDAFSSISLFKNAQGKEIGYTVISRDLSKSQQIARILLKHVESEEELESKNKELEETTRTAQEANRLKGEFIANVSHELRTPLNGIIGFAELLYDGMVDPASPIHKEFLGDILSSARHLLLLINDVLDLEKVASGKMQFHPEHIHLDKVVKETQGIFTQLLAKKYIQFIVEIDREVNEIVFDSARLKQILYNYVSNAIKFTPDGGRIKIQITPQKENNFLLEIHDTGIGIRESDISKLFIEFQQLDASRSKKYPGTGLGLALTKRIVEALGGKVGVKSVYGKGSTFYAILPRDIQHLKINLANKLS